jgi:putative nucleotide binding protein
MEDYARILDYLPQGLPDEKMFHRDPVAYALGEDQFKLFELVPKQGVNLSTGDKVYIGKDLDLRQEILHVKKRIGFNELTNASQSELPFVILQIIKAHEARFVQFFNESQAITTRFHMLELLPGLGKKTMWSIIEERKKGPFKDFVDISKRVPLAHQIEKLVAKRIEEELANPDEKYRLFVAR